MEKGAPLVIAQSLAGHDDEVTEGTLRCTRAGCQCEFPIIDSIPMIVPRVREFVAANSVQLSMRDDLSADSQRMLAECSGPGSWLDAIHQHLSSYAWDHYAEFDREEPSAEPKPGGVARAVELAGKYLSLKGGAPSIDIGCSVGRASFELAGLSGGLVLGVDTHIPMLRLAQRVLRTGEVSYLRRSLGMLYDRRRFPARFENAKNVDFWACDATALPFSPATFGGAVSFNVLDCVPSPLDHLRSISHVLSKGGRAMLTTPYDWSGAATPLEAWIGGHSPHGHFSGKCADVLRAILTPGAHPASVAGLRLLAEVQHVPWHVRMHDRSSMRYDLHLAVVEAVDTQSL
jgi:SAM-dependent methyltransferase/uncharacterized protein YbaR (Trm112 family)